MGARVFEFTKTIRRTLRALIEEGVKTGAFAKEADSRLMTEIFVSELESSTLRIVLGMERDSQAATHRFSRLVDAFATR